MIKKQLNENIVVMGLGYVGLPVAAAFSKVCECATGFDVDEDRIEELKTGFDRAGEMSAEDLSTLGLSSDPACILNATVVIVTVPTPTDASNRPDLTPLRKACVMIGKHMRPGAMIVFESTVYPTVTEEICGPILEENSGLKCGIQFKLAYSPERINPGDRERSLSDIPKVVAGQDDETTERVAKVYEAIISAGIHKAASICVAEASKVIENTQRDLNIALMNELSIICRKLGIRTLDVIEAAATKWNFLPFTPGLVGGHCIGVDPYYLTAKAEELGYHPGVILAGRRVNDSMGEYVAHQAVKLLASANLPVREARVGILGATFKENVPDFRNSKVFDIIEELNSYGIAPMLDDPFMEFAIEFDCDVSKTGLENFKDLHCLILAVSHDDYTQRTTPEYEDMLVQNGVFMDVKSVFTKGDWSPQTVYWCL
jgi:UDP-N-acetyl-D-galactosamine dehydrogenase